MRRAVGRESIAAVIEAYGRGEIELEKPQPHQAGQLFQAGKSERIYNLATVARFLRWTKSARRRQRGQQRTASPLTAPTGARRITRSRS